MPTRVPVLVVGATGELGFAVAARLRRDGTDVVALVRPTTDARPLEGLGVRVVRGDLTEPASFPAALEGVGSVVATANGIVPRRGERVDVDALAVGYEHLGRAAVRAGVSRFVLASVPAQFFGRGAPEFDAKARVEAGLRRDGVPLVVARASLFMESWLTQLGSRLPVRASARPTVDRGFWLSRLASVTTQQSIDRAGVALVPGRGRTRHAFVAVDDVAGALVAAATGPFPGDQLRLGGPEALSWDEAVDAFERVLARRLRRVRQPAAPFGWLARAAGPRSPAAAHLLAVQGLVARVGSPYPPDDTRRLLGREPVGVEVFLRDRAFPGEAETGN